MPISNREAYELKRQGNSVPVVCNQCDVRVWTAKATYIEGEDEWYCSDCQDRLVEELADGLLDEDDVDPEDVKGAVPDDWGENDG